MIIEAICAPKGLHREYLLRASHKEVMQLGATTFEPGDFLNILSAIEHLERMATQLRSVSRLMRDADELISVLDQHNAVKA